jgi:hypothetical protein
MGWGRLIKHEIRIKLDYLYWFIDRRKAINLIRKLSCEGFIFYVTLMSLFNFLNGGKRIKDD